MQTGAGHEEIGPALRSLGEANVPAHIVVRNIICSLAGPNAVLAADAFAEIDSHTPIMFRISFFLVGLLTNTLNGIGRKGARSDQLREDSSRAGGTSYL